METILSVLFAAGVIGVLAGLAALIPDDARALPRSRVDAFSGIDMEPQGGRGIIRPLARRARPRAVAVQQPCVPEPCPEATGPGVPVRVPVRYHRA